MHPHRQTHPDHAPVRTPPTTRADREQPVTHGTLLNAPPNADISDWAATWDEHRIRTRGTYLASLSLAIWPHANGLRAGLLSSEHADV